MTLAQIGTTHRVRVSKDSCGDSIIRGMYGHLYVDAGKVVVCFTDDPQTTTRKPSTKPLTARRKNFALAKLGSAVVTQDAECEFIAEISEGDIPTALFDVLRVKRIRTMSTAQRIVLENARLVNPLVQPCILQERHLQPVGSLAGAGMVC